MAQEYADIRVEGEDDIKILGKSSKGAELLLVAAIDEIGAKIDEEAKLFAPVGKTGDLKKHPVDVKRISGVTTDVHSIGGGFSVRGAGGQFVAASPESSGKTVNHIEITVASEPHYAIWVHEGTGVYGEYHTPIVPRSSKYMIFHHLGKRWRVKSVLGQKPQPFLTEAFAVAETTYIPFRIEQLKAEVQALYS